MKFGIAAGLFVAAVALTLSVSAKDRPHDEIAFVYAMVRHGARAPIQYQEPYYFNVPKGTLTATGLREKYLSGKYERKRYVRDYDLLDKNFNPHQLHVQSTDVSRTIMSAYAKMMGLYPPSSKREGAQITKN
jgi:hypothetical protein